MKNLVFREDILAWNYMLEDARDWYARIYFWKVLCWGRVKNKLQILYEILQTYEERPS